MKKVFASAALATGLALSACSAESLGGLSPIEATLDVVSPGRDVSKSFYVVMGEIDVTIDEKTCSQVLNRGASLPDPIAVSEIEESVSKKILPARLVQQLAGKAALVVCKEDGLLDEMSSRKNVSFKAAYEADLICRPAASYESEEMCRPDIDSIRANYE